MTKTVPPAEDAPARITARITELGDWRGQILAHVRQLIHDAVPGVQEEWKWAKATSPGVPVWSYGGGLCTGEVYQHAVKFTFFRGAKLPDPAGLFNASLSGAARRAIDLKQGQTLDDAAFRDLIRAAVAANAAAKKT